MNRTDRQPIVVSPTSPDTGAQQHVKLLLFGLLFVMLAAQAVSVLNARAQRYFTNPLVTLGVDVDGQEKGKQKPVP
ncbi:MAG: hypothetical protein CMH57_15370 [Myxococcales bacterium]|nr:hypothetical protein [Myxococcales bacterium]